MYLAWTRFLLCLCSDVVTAGSCHDSSWSHYRLCLMHSPLLWEYGRKNFWLLSFRTPCPAPGRLVFVLCPPWTHLPGALERLSNSGVGGLHRYHSLLSACGSLEIWGLTSHWLYLGSFFFGSTILPKFCSVFLEVPCVNNYIQSSVLVLIPSPLHRSAFLYLCLSTSVYLEGMAMGGKEAL